MGRRLASESDRVGSAKEAYLVAETRLRRMLGLLQGQIKDIEEDFVRPVPNAELGFDD